MPARAQTNRTPRLGPAWHEQNHFDIGALAQRVTGLENAIGNIGDQLRDIGTRLETQQASFSAAGRTDWKSWWGTAASILGVLIVLGAAILSPIISDMKEMAQDIRDGRNAALAKDDFKAAVEAQQQRNLAMDATTAEVAKTLTTTQVSLAALDRAGTERHDEYLRDRATIQGRVDMIDSNLIKRPEIESIVNGLGERISSTSSSANDRINSVIESLNELRHDVGANYTLGDGLKSALDRIDRIQTQINLLVLPSRESPVPVPAPR